MKLWMPWLTCLVLAALGAGPGPARAGEPQGPRTLIVAAVQTANLDHAYTESRERAERLIAEAAGRGARLVLLPEFALIGYRFHDDLWQMAEPLEGPTVAWMRELCRRYQIYLATCILEVRDQDFYDTLVLVGPGEGELWTHRKIEPALFEARYFKGAGLNPAVFETPLGRIGFAICYDTSKAHTVRNLLADRPELLVMTFSAPETPKPMPEKIRRQTIDSQYSLPVTFAQILGAPVISCSKTGRFDSPFPGVPGLHLRSDFEGRSRIVAPDGAVLAALEKEEGVIVAEVELGQGIEPRPQDIPEGRWLAQFSGLIRWFSDYTLHQGEHRYERSEARREAVAEAKARNPASSLPSGDSGNED